MLTDQQRQALPVLSGSGETVEGFLQEHSEEAARDDDIAATDKALPP